MDICTKLKKYFKEEVDTLQIYHQLTAHGMYRNSFPGIEQMINILKERKTWRLIDNYSTELRKKWNGPDVPIFIFPAEPTQRNLNQGIDGKSGLAFRDKIFLFISDHLSEEELKALLIHEYNHVCRLEMSPRHEKEYVLLDTIILEGLAENAVRSILGNDFVAPWIKKLTLGQMQRLWRRMIYPNRNLSTRHPKHDQILYGRGLYPNKAGYAVGYFLVDRYRKTNKLKTKELLYLPSTTICEININD